MGSTHRVLGSTHRVLCYSTEGMVQYLWVAHRLADRGTIDRQSRVVQQEVLRSCAQSIGTRTAAVVTMSQRIRQRPMRRCRSAATVRNGALSPGSAIRQCRTRKLTSPRMCTSAKQSLARGLVVSESSHRSDPVRDELARDVWSEDGAVRAPRVHYCCPVHPTETGLPRPLDVSPY